MESKHTPGPWRVTDIPGARDKDAIYIASANDGALVASVMAYGMKHKGRENAALIARAPDLLAENARLRAILGRFYAATYGRTDLVPPLDFEQARAAMARAGGAA